MFGQPRGRLMLSLRALAPALFRGSSQTNAVSHQLSLPLCLLNICNCPLFDGFALQSLHQLKVAALHFHHQEMFHRSVSPCQLRILSLQGLHLV